MQLWQPNQQLQNGKFTIQKVLGGGGYGVTYSAIHTNTNNVVAIKTLNPIHHSQADFEQQQDSFVKEAFRLAKCSHPHIVKVHDVIKEGGLWGMVMEYIQGEDLAVRIDKSGKLSEDEALKYIQQIGSALEYMHQQGTLHRDVKPANIMLRDGKQEAVLIDFGLAREFNRSKTRSMTNAKTEGYAPIEQYEKRGRFGAYTDVYALAATLYTLVTGDTPLPANFRNTGIPLPSPKERNPEISDRLNDVIIKGMGLEPYERTQTVREWLDLIIQVKCYQNPPDHTPEQIKLQKFKFEYATVSIKQGLFGRKCKVNRHSREAEYFTEDLGNGISLDMVYIPGGSFMMGTEDAEIEKLVKKFDNNIFRIGAPQHQVNVPAFFMGKYPVTQAQWKQVAALPKINQEVASKPSRFKGENRPLEILSWFDAVEFCARLSKATGKEYRLPSEAEWEYACRAGTTTPFHFGETITTDLANYRGTDWENNGTLYPGNYGDAPKGIFREQTTPVGKFPANAFGLYDMHGNVSEWCLDDWHENYQGATIDGSAWFDDENDNLDEKFLLGRAVLRGGSWYLNPVNCRSACRDNSRRNVYSFDDVGFRIVYVSGKI